MIKEYRPFDFGGMPYHCLWSNIYLTTDIGPVAYVRIRADITRALDISRWLNVGTLCHIDTPLYIGARRYIAKHQGLISYAQFIKQGLHPGSQCLPNVCKWIGLDKTRTM